MKVPILALMLLAAAASPALAQSAPSGEAIENAADNAAESAAQQTFAADMIARLSAAHPQATFRSSAKDPLQIEVSGAQWSNGQLYLHRVYGFCQTASAPACEDGKARMVAVVMSPPPTPQRENLRVVVRGADYIGYAQAKAAQEKQPWFFVRKIGDDLYEALALDGPNVIGLASAADLKAMKLKPDDAWALGRAQTRAQLQPLPDPAEFLSDTVTFEGREYVGSVLADTAGWQAIRDAIGPDLFVTITTDQFVMASLLEAGPALDRFAQAVAEDCRNAERCISPHIYRFEHGMWVIEQ